MLSRIRGLLKDEEGATMVEYALMLALIAAVCIVIVTTLGESANTKFEAVNTALEATPAP